MKADGKKGGGCRWLLLLAAVLAGGCTATLPPTGGKPQRSIDMYEQPDAVYPVRVADPLGGANRRIYRFNYYFDRYLFLPVVRGYRFVMPDYAEDRVSSALDNVLELTNLTNTLLQLKWKESAVTVGRVVTNSTLGILGLWDPATGMGMRRQDEDFGQTLGHYGVRNGPYLVLPVIGPSNLRDAAGLAGDTLAFNLIDPLNFDHNEGLGYAFNGIYAVDKRKRTPFRYFETGSPFEYEWIRLLYTEKRHLQIAE